ncbi:hypothetical protein [Aquibacillus salsiterrae]|uniref:Uncharacterized protein n=1 Tax=Aquibacillus salsiterrae TaxID=2950439 RepID=A0A9X3WJR8_9BACI|nr:hypothetical protein [Aquibacillus salsiterrae]MDC3418679.1 hypothetical protein [Aquibacillus salsiterrae]
MKNMRKSVLLGITLFLLMIFVFKFYTNNESTNAQVTDYNFKNVDEGIQIKKEDSKNPVEKIKIGKEFVEEKETQNIERIEQTAYLEKTYNSVDELTNASDFIIQGEVLATDSFDYNTSTYTKSSIKVTNSYKGNFNTGVLITVIEPGGITTLGALKNYTNGKLDVDKEEIQKPVEIVFNGIPVMKTEQKVIIFGKRPNTNYLIDEEYYFVVGAYQGKFNIKGDSVERFTTGKGVYKSLKMSRTDIETKIKKSLKDN